MLLCPTCNNPVAAEDLNIGTDVAFCRGCNRAFAISDVVHGGAHRREAFDRAAPVPGTWLRDDGVETVIGASTRSPMAFVLVPFMAIWSGLSLGGIYGTQIASGKFSLTASLFGIPFLLGSVVLGSFALMFTCGRVEVRLRGGEGQVVTGVGPLARTRRFLVSEIAIVREDWAGYSTNRTPRKGVVLEGARRIMFGSMLSEARRYFVLQNLRSTLKLPG